MLSISTFTKRSPFNNCFLQGLFFDLVGITQFKYLQGFGNLAGKK